MKTISIKVTAPDDYENDEDLLAAFLDDPEGFEVEIVGGASDDGEGDE